MSDLAMSRRAVTRAIVTLPVIAAAPATALPVGTSSNWQAVKASYRAAFAETTRMIDAFMDAENNLPDFPKPKPTEPTSGLDQANLLDMTLRQIKAMEVDQATWDAYKEARNQWTADWQAWEETHIGEVRRAYGSAFDKLHDAIAAVASCRVHTIQDLADKIALGEEIFANVDGIEADEKDQRTYFAVLADDAQKLGGAA